MGENSKIQWCDHTFNPFIGCTKVSPGCTHCYAMLMMDHRYQKVKWGPQGTRMRTAKAYWKQPLKWNETVWVECEVCGERQVYDPEALCPACRHPLIRTKSRARQRVFCGSLCDVFEEKRDQMVEMDQWRVDLFKLIEQTPNLDWLLLTKRPENVEWMIEVALFTIGIEMQAGDWLKSHPNVWIGTSVEDQEWADKRIPELLKIPAKVRFLSCEPLLGPVIIDKFLGWEPGQINWVICGGESGPDARPMDPDWVRSLERQCLNADDVPFFFKQWGEWLPKSHMWYAGLKEDMTFKKKPVQMENEIMLPVGKHRSGNFLDGHEDQAFPILNRYKIPDHD